MSAIETFVAAVEVRVAGTPLGAEMNDCVEVRLDQNLMLPDAFTLTFADPDPEFALTDASTFAVGVPVELAFCSPSGRRLKTLFKGEITTLEPEFGQDGTLLVVRGYDRSHRLNRGRKTATHQNMTAAQIAKKIAGEAGLTADVQETGPQPPPEFVQQNNETDWEFLWRLMSKFDFEVVVDDRSLKCRPAGSGGEEVEIAWGEDLFSFRPRLTGVEQINDVVVRAWDPGRKDVIEARKTTASVDPLSSTIGITRNSLASALGGGKITVAEAPVSSSGEAQKLADALASMKAHAYLEAVGVCLGNPDVAKGTVLRIRGVGQRFGGKYQVSSVTHVFSNTRGYLTKFTVAGRTPRSLLDLMTPKSKGRSSGWANSLVVGVVTNNQDPEQMGRVRVKYPALDGTAEGWWARITTPHAGPDRGLLMMPKVGDEVLMGFEGGDPHKPYVVGALYNGQAKPGEMVDPDGSFWLKSDKFIEVRSKDNITIKGDKDLAIDIRGKITEKAGNDITIEGNAKITVKAGTSITIEGGQDVTVKAGGGQVALKPGGMVEVSGTQVSVKGNAMVQVSAPQVMLG